MRSIRRILLVRLSHLGDVVHALPIFHALRAEHPTARIAWAVQPEFAGLVEGLEGIERVVHFDRRGGARAWIALRDELARFGADWAIDAQGNVKSALVTLCSGAPRRSGWDRGDWTERFAAHVLTDAAPPLPRRGLHAVERALHLARYVAPAGAAHLPALLWSTSEAQLERGRERALELFGEPAEGEPVVLHLAAAGDVRSWPSARFETLARELARAGARVAILSGPAEAALGAELRDALLRETGIAHWVGQRGLLELAAFFRAAAERGARLVCCDSGPLHVAAACGLPVVALGGPQDAARTGPWPPPGGGSPHRVVRAAAEPPCAPCLARRCTHPDGAVCMSRITPALVEHALLREREVEASCA